MKKKIICRDLIHELNLALESFEKSRKTIKEMMQEVGYFHVKAFRLVVQALR